MTNYLQGTPYMKNKNGLEKIQASTELGIFFKRLLELKEFVKEKATEEKSFTLNSVYEKLDDLIKEGKDE